MSLTYGVVLTQGYGWSQASVGLVNVRILRRRDQFTISSDFGLVRYPSGGSPGNVLGRLPRRQDEPLACKTARRYSPSGRHSRDTDLPDDREHDRNRRLRFGRGKARVLHLMVDHHGYVDPNWGT